MENVLQVMRECYEAMALVQSRHRVGGWTYKYAKVVQDSLDDLTEELTGDRERLKQGHTVLSGGSLPPESAEPPTYSADEPRRRRTA